MPGAEQVQVRQPCALDCAVARAAVGAAPCGFAFIQHLPKHCLPLEAVLSHGRRLPAAGMAWHVAACRTDAQSSMHSWQLLALLAGTMAGRPSKQAAAFSAWPGSARGVISLHACLKQTLIRQLCACQLLRDSRTTLLLQIISGAACHHYLSLKRRSSSVRSTRAHVLQMHVRICCVALRYPMWKTGSSSCM